jgi:hypothetical protein
LDKSVERGIRLGLVSIGGEWFINYCSSKVGATCLWHIDVYIFFMIVFKVVNCVFLIIVFKVISCVPYIVYFLVLNPGYIIEKISLKAKKSKWSCELRCQFNMILTAAWWEQFSLSTFLPQTTHYNPYFLPHTHLSFQWQPLLYKQLLLIQHFFYYY